MCRFKICFVNFFSRTLYTLTLHIIKLNISQTQFNSCTTHYFVSDQLILFQENSDIYNFEVTPAEINSLKNLDKGEGGRIFNFLFWKGVEKHPEYPFDVPHAV